MTDPTVPTPRCETCDGTGTPRGDYKPNCPDCYGTGVGDELFPPLTAGEEASFRAWLVEYAARPAETENQEVAYTLRLFAMHDAARRQIEELAGALREIEKGEGAYSRDRFTHAFNTVENMKSIARAALASTPAPSSGEVTPEQNVERDRLWCKVLTQTLTTDLIQKVTSRFNELRPAARTEVR